MQSRRPAIVVLMLFIASLAPRARGEDVWRLVGTFNTWNTNDPAWEMKPAPSLPGGNSRVYELVRPIDPGTYKFKFVKNGSWDAGHLGGDPNRAPGILTSPGDDLTLDIKAKGSYRVELDAAAPRWSLHVAHVDKPQIISHTLGRFVAGEPFVLDVSESLFDSDAGDARFTCTATQGQASITDIAGNPWRRLVTPSSSGALTLALRLSAGGAQADSSLHADVLAAAPPSAVDPKATQIKYVPAGDAPAAWTVQLIGDFNNWRVPGAHDAAGTLPLESHADGTFTTSIVLPDGAYRYQFLVNGTERRRDLENKAFARAEDGSACSVLFIGKTAADYPPVQPNAIDSEAIRHNPSLQSDFRAIDRSLGLFDVSVLTLPQDAQYAYVQFNAAPGVIGDADTAESAPGARERRLMVHMHRQSDLSGFERWTARIMTGIDAPNVTYSFAFKDGPAEFITKDYHAALDPSPPAPAWAMGAVWYQIFPERFRNGNALNDPAGPGITLMPWTSDWYKVEQPEADAWRKRAHASADTPVPARAGSPMYTVVWDRRYGGDLQGIVEKLDYIKSLGVTAIYLNPIFQAESMHKYDASDYRHIDAHLAWPKEAGAPPEKWTPIASETQDPATWTWTPADRYFVDTFIPEAHKRGMKVIIDGVFNHTGRAFWAFHDIETRGKDSPYKDWYYVNFDESGRLKSWTSWYNSGELPKFHQTDDGDLIPPVKEHIFNITRRWMDPNNNGHASEGVDGWRLDVALDVGLPFWRDWRKLVKSINPDAFITAEIWDDASQYLHGDTFDTHMHYPFAKAVTDWLGVRKGATTPQLIGKLNTAFDDAPQTNLIHQNLFDSHDTDRVASMLFNPGRDYDQGNRLQDADGRKYRGDKPDARCYKLVRLGVAVQATYLGAPMVYYGDEVGMYGADDPTDRKPYPWPDLGAMANANDSPDADLLAYYKSWLHLRSDPAVGPILRYGSLRHLNTASDGVFAYTRELNGRRVVTVVNRTDQAFDAARLLPADTTNAQVPALEAKWWALDENGVD